MIFAIVSRFRQTIAFNCQTLAVCNCSIYTSYSANARQERILIPMEVASSWPDHLPTLSAAKTSKLSLLVKSPIGSRAANVGNAAPSFCLSVPAISKLTTLIVESLWTAPTETAKHHVLVIDEAS